MSERESIGHEPAYSFTASVTGRSATRFIAWRLGVSRRSSDWLFLSTNHPEVCVNAAHTFIFIVRAQLPAPLGRTGPSVCWVQFGGRLPPWIDLDFLCRSRSEWDEGCDGERAEDED